jgi:hypothetical protein
MGSGKVDSFKIARVIRALVKDKRANPAAPVTLAVSPCPGQAEAKPAPGQG